MPRAAHAPVRRIPTCNGVVASPIALERTAVVVWPPYRRRPTPARIVGERTPRELRDPGNSIGAFDQPQSRGRCTERDGQEARQQRCRTS
jgi:hypothetical protein